jgi:hypothetical protein
VQIDTPTKGHHETSNVVKAAALTKRMSQASLPVRRRGIARLIKAKRVRRRNSRSGSADLGPRSESLERKLVVRRAPKRRDKITQLTAKRKAKSVNTILNIQSRAIVRKDLRSPLRKDSWSS